MSSYLESAPFFSLSVQKKSAVLSYAEKKDAEIMAYLDLCKLLES